MVAGSDWYVDRDRTWEVYRKVNGGVVSVSGAEVAFTTLV